MVALLLAIPSPTQSTPSGEAVPPSIQVLRAWFPAAASVDPSLDGRWAVKDAAGDRLGEVARTLPEAADVVGYRGPTEAMIALDDELHVVGVGLLSSADTDEHVQAVQRDEAFFAQFQSWDWRTPPKGSEVDAVSGATLTSLALAEGVLKRMGGDEGSLIFPDELNVDDVKDWFPDAKSVAVEYGIGFVKNAAGETLGRVVRSGRFSDDIIGYQGPTELLIKIEDDDQVSSIQIRRSYDNEPYVRYVKEDKYSWSRLTGQTLSKLAELNPEEAGIEGVSGATMTSLAVADTVAATAKQAVAAVVKSRTPPPTFASTLWSSLEAIRWNARDLATMLTLLIAVLLSRFNQFHRRGLRQLWLVGVLMVIGLWSGNLVSMSLVAGWSAEGIAWQLAPGLAAIVLVAMVIPPITKSNPYCNHLCPHGAVQQLIKPSGRSRRKWQPPAGLSSWLTKIPGATLVVAYVTLIMVPSVDLSSWEPFHAYLFRIAGWGALALCGLSLVIAMFVPMGYCRMGCPTGSLIDFLRRTAKSDRIEFADTVAVMLLVIATAKRII